MAGRTALSTLKRRRPGDSAPATTGSLLYRGLENIAAQARLDKIALPLRNAVRHLPSSMLGVLRGNWLGHVLHPAATDWPHAAWLGASLLDGLGGRGTRPASQRLVGAGLLGAGAAIASGAADWSEDVGGVEDHRAGLVHGAVLTLATGIYAASYATRRRDHHAVGAVLALAGAATTTVGDYIGGHLSLGRGIGAAATAHHHAHVPAGTENPTWRSRLLGVTGWVEGREWLDAPGHHVGTTLGHALSPGALKNVLTGAWLGHPLHPLLTDFPIGAWMSASFLDILGGPTSRPAAEKLAAFGLAAALPTAAAGAAEWVDTDVRSRRVGMVHAILNTAAWTLYAASLACRRLSYGVPVALRLTGGAAAAAGSYLGGHLSIGRAVGVSCTAQVHLPRQWTAAFASDDLEVNGMLKAVVAEQDVLLVADGSAVHALAAVCTHRGGPLDRGVVADGCVTCPWHGSRFRLRDGSVVRGPASVPEPAGEARRRDGSVEVRRR